MGENRIVCQVGIHFEAFLNINTVLLCKIICVIFRKWMIFLTVLGCQIPSQPVKCQMNRLFNCLCITALHITGGSSHSVLQFMLNTIPLQRLGTRTEIAEAVVFLCSEAASYITGTVLVVDGAHWMVSARSLHEITSTVSKL